MSHSHPLNCGKKRGRITAVYSLNPSLSESLQGAEACLSMCHDRYVLYWLVRAAPAHMLRLQVHTSVYNT